MAGDPLIVSPITLSFQAPLAHFQKRMITLINASDEDVVYRIEMDDNDYSVLPMRGKVKAFNTSELSVILKPVEKDIPVCSLVVRSIPMTMVAEKEEVEWNTTDIPIELDPQKTLQLEDDPKVKQAEGLVKKESSGSFKTWLRMLLALAFVAVILAVLFSKRLNFNRILEMRFN